MQGVSDGMRDWMKGLMEASKDNCDKDSVDQYDLSLFHINIWEILA